MVETPLKFKVPSPSPVRLCHEALIIIASAPEALGDDSTAYALTPSRSYLDMSDEVQL